jgi:hypothetical protein
MKTAPLAVALLLLSLAALYPASATAQTKIDLLTRWEYRVQTREQILKLGDQDLAAGLNKIGAEGWELAAIDKEYIFKRRVISKAKVEELQRRIADAESDLEQWKDRAAWSERMYKKGFLSAEQAAADRTRLRAAEAALELARRDFDALPPDLKKPAEKLPDPK